MLKVIQHIYIMPSSVWAEALLHPNNFSILGPYMMIFLHFVDWVDILHIKLSAKCNNDNVYNRIQRYLEWGNKVIIKLWKEYS